MPDATPTGTPPARRAGIGGPWHNTAVEAGVPSDPYLMYGYEDKRLRLTCEHETIVEIQVDPSGTGDWHTCFVSLSEAGKPVEFTFPDGFNAHWVRLVSHADTTATATFYYNADVDFAAAAVR